MNSPHVELRNAEWRLVVNPAMGGCVLGLWLGDIPVLRPAPADAKRAGQSAAYPLVPFSNRIGSGKMLWSGEQFALRNGFNDEPHALHGVGFMSTWQMVGQSETSLVLRLTHQPDEFWPFAFVAEQQFELREDGLRYTIRARNTDTRSQPMGLGWHPYFARRPGVNLDLPVHTHWLSAKDKLPTEPKTIEGLNGAVAGMRTDHCFEGGQGGASLSDSELNITLWADSRYWVVYTPENADFFCVEPVTHLNNAVQCDDPQKHGLVELLPGVVLLQQAFLSGKAKSQTPE